MPRLLVCGSRDWDDQDTIADVLADYAPERHVVAIHGAARGADTLAAEVADLYGFDVRAFPADWKRHGQRAGFIRNLAMLDERPDLVIAFHKDGSRGTLHTIQNARMRGIAVRVITPSEPEAAGPLAGSEAGGHNPKAVRSLRSGLERDGDK